MTTRCIHPETLRPPARNLSKPDIATDATPKKGPDQTVNEKSAAPRSNIGNDKKADKLVRHKKAANPFLPSRECSDNQIRSLLALAHPDRYQYRPDSLLDLESGEVITEPRAVIDILLGRQPPLFELFEPIKSELSEPPRARVGYSENSENLEFLDSIKSDPLIADLIADGGTVAAVEYTA
jgi:hypothetical protein